jgi:methionine-rich copper-binding protein CopC
MRPMRFGYRSKMAAAIALVALAFCPRIATARSLQVRESLPAAEAIIHGHHAEYVIRFDGPVNHVASRMEITQDNHIIQTLTPLADSAVDVLFADSAVPPPGRYMLHWEAVSSDGTLSKGDIPFNAEP